MSYRKPTYPQLLPVPDGGTITIAEGELAGHVVATDGMGPTEADYDRLHAWIDQASKSELWDYVWYESEQMMRDQGLPTISGTLARIDAGLPSKAIEEHWTLDSWPASTPARVEAKRAAQALLDGWSRTGLLLMGQYGRAKTGLAVSIAVEALRRRQSVRFVSWRSFLRETFQALEKKHPRGKSVSRLQAGLFAADLLVIDDLGDPDAKKPDEWSRRMLHDVVWPRYDAMKPMVITSNLSLDQLKMQFGEAAVSRIFDACALQVLDGPDERMARLGVPA